MHTQGMSAPHAPPLITLHTQPLASPPLRPMFAICMHACTPRAHMLLACMRCSTSSLRPSPLLPHVVHTVCTTHADAHPPPSPPSTPLGRVVLIASDCVGLTSHRLCVCHLSMSEYVQWRKQFQPAPRQLRHLQRHFDDGTHREGVCCRCLLLMVF